ncbi:hypothetical protein BH24BAC1_BH24BAC1_26710 [soil metagenome]
MLNKSHIFNSTPFSAFLFFCLSVFAACQRPQQGGSPTVQAEADGRPAQAASAPASSDDRFYEMRIYYAAPGKLEDLNARFRNHTMGLFSKHGMTNIGYWTPIENPENKLVYVLAYPSREARDASWKAFGADPQWQTAQAASEEAGRLVARVDSIYMKATDYSPAIRPSTSGAPQVFEMRTYTASPGNLNNLHARFRNHTVGLFSNYGMSHVGYWTPVDADKGADNTLVYILAHRSEDAAKKSFDAFRQDPTWVKAREASEAQAGGSLTTKVESVFMVPTDYSPTR